MQLLERRMLLSASGVPIVRLAGAPTTEPYDLFAWQDHLYFTAATSKGKTGIWSSDGVHAAALLGQTGTPPQLHGLPSDSVHFFPATSQIFFYDDTIPGSLWRTNGTPVGTVRVLNSSTLAHYGFIADGVIGNKFYFRANAGTGYKQWVSDGTSAGTHQVSGTPVTVPPPPPVKINGHTLTVSGGQLYGSNGASKAALLPAKIYSVDSQTQFYTVGAQAFFKASAAGVTDLFVTDGTPGGTHAIDAYPQFSPLGIAQGRFLFTALDGLSHQRIWTSDGALAGTIPVTSVAATSSGYIYVDAAIVGNNLFFKAVDSTHGYGIWELPADTKAPAAPKNLVAKAAGGSQINLTWTNGGGTEYGQAIQRSAAASFAVIDHVFTAEPGTSTFADKTGLQPGATYYYRIQSFNRGASSAFAVAAPVTVPGVLKASSLAGVVYNDSNGDGTRQAGEVGLSGRTIFLDLNKNGKLDSGEPHTVTSSNGIFTFTSLAAGVYRVGEIIPAGWRSTTAPAGFIELGVAPAKTATQDLGQSQTTSVSGSVFLDANGNGKQDAGETSISGRVVYIDTNNNNALDPGEPKSTTDADGTFSVIAKAGQFSLRIVPVAGFQTTVPGTGAFLLNLASGQVVTGEIFGQAPAIPTAPSNLSAIAATGAASGHEVDLTWSDNSNNETGFTLQRSQTVDFKVIDLSVPIAANRTGYVDTTVSPVQTYYYRIDANNAGGNSAYATASVTTPDIVLTTPTGFAAAAVAPTEVDLKWDKLPAGLTVLVERATGGGSFSQIGSTTLGSYVDNTVHSSTAYQYRIRASTSARTSGYSTTASAVTVQLPAWPSLAAGTFPDFLTSFNGKLYYRAQNNSFQNTFYATDGTTDPVALGGGGAFPVAYNGQIYYGQYEFGVGGELWKTDGTPGGTSMVTSVNATMPSWLTVSGGNLYFFTSSDGGITYQAWVTDGTAAHTGQVPVSGIVIAHGTDTPVQPIDVNGTLFVTTADGWLWKSNGTAGGTVKVKNFTKVFDLTSFGGKAYFFANDGVNGYGLWKSDGTALGTTLVQANFTGVFSPPVEALSVCNGLLYFTATNPDYGVWRSDGSSGGTFRLSAGDAFLQIAPLQGLTYYISGGTLYQTDGSVAGTAAVRPVATHFAHAPLPYMLSAGSNLFYTDGNDMLWTSDGTALGSRLIASINSDVTYQQSALGNLALSFGGKLYFTANNDTAMRVHSIPLVTPAGAPALSVQSISPSPSASVQLSWTYSFANVASFVLERSQDAGFSSINAVFVIAASATGFSDMTVSSGTYYYRLVAETALGQSVSSVVSAPVP